MKLVNYNKDNISKIKKLYRSAFPCVERKSFGFIIRQCEKGEADMLALQEILGHANVATTQIYTHISRSQLQEAVAASPLAKLNMGPGAKHRKNSGLDAKENQPEENLSKEPAFPIAGLDDSDSKR